MDPNTQQADPIGEAMAQVTGGVPEPTLTPEQQNDVAIAEAMEMFTGVEPVTEEESFMRDVEHAVEKDMGKTEKAGFIEGVGRSTFLGGAADPIAAKIIQLGMNGKIPGFAFELAGGDADLLGKMPDMTYDEAMAIVKDNEKDVGLGAQIVGAVLGGGAFVSGAKMAGRATGVTEKLLKNGMVRGAAKWASKDKFVNRVFAAAALGGGAGAAEEAARVGINELADHSAGGEFEGQKIIDAAITGGMIGGIATPAFQEVIMRGGKGLTDYFRGAFGSNAVQSQQAANRMLKAISKPGEEPEMALARLQQTIQQFKNDTGEMPALADILKPEQVREMAGVIRNVQGLDETAREYGEAGIERALRRFRQDIDNGNLGMSPVQIEHAQEELFTDMMETFGSKRVAVDEDTIRRMTVNSDWLEKAAKNAEEGSGASQILSVVQARKSIDGARSKLMKAREATNVAEQRKYIAELDEELALLIENGIRKAEAEAGEEGVKSSAESMLSRLIKLKTKITNRISADAKARQANEAYENSATFFNNIDDAISRYEQDGLYITLSDANDLRAKASRLAYDSRSDPMVADQALAVRDAIARVGVDEVPQYGQAVRDWSLNLSRRDAQSLGRDAAKGAVDLDDLRVRVLKGRLKGKPPARKDGDRVAAIQRGADEGANRAIAMMAGGDTTQALATANKLVNSPQVKRGLDMVSSNSVNMQESAQRVMDSYEGLKQLVAPNSPTGLQMEMENAREVATSLAFGSLGGAGRAAWYTRLFMHFKIPRGTSRKIVDMLGDPDQVDNALDYMKKKGIRLGPFFGAITAALASMGEE